jgi:hypothetical protein
MSPFRRPQAPCPNNGDRIQIFCVGGGVFAHPSYLCCMFSSMLLMVNIEAPELRKAQLGPWKTILGGSGAGRAILIAPQLSAFRMGCLLGRVQSELTWLNDEGYSQN